MDETKLDQKKQLYSWPKVKKSKFTHINSITTYPGVIIYDIDIDEPNITNNVILQNINGNYYLISTYGEPHHDNDLLVEPIDPEKFFSIITQRLESTAFSPKIPLTNDDLD